MSDLIDRQAAIDAVNRLSLGETDATRLAMRIWDYLERLPSAQPDIVRCKDCKHYQYADNRAFGFPVRQCEWTGFEDVDEDDFCSRAEKR